MKRFELLDHTADTGIIVYADNLQSLFETAGEALFHIITDLRKVSPRIERTIEIEAKPLERLMVDWLSELLYLYDVECLLFKEFEVEVLREGGLKARARGENYQEGVHIIKTGVKAVTYHQIEVREEDRRWRAKVILDL